MGGEGWGIEKPSGFNKIVELIIEAARRVIEVMHQKNQDLQRQLTDIQDRKTENQEQHLPLPIFDLSVEMTELNKLSARYYATYAGCKAHALGLIMADMLSSEAREILIGMIMNGKSIDEIKEQVGNFEMSEQPEAVLSL